MKRGNSPKHGKRLYRWQATWWWIIPALMATIAIWSVLALVARGLPPEVLMAGIALILGVAYFFQQQHLQQTRFFKELVTEFNGRYNAMNSDLLKTLQDEERFEEQKFVSYFNLCAEEWLFYKTGYIYDPVWQAWEKGMEQFGKNSRVADLWQQERQTGSYYGFEFPVQGTAEPERS
jgi:hypothetical protein